jgi:hypothetical protein
MVRLYIYPPRMRVTDPLLKRGWQHDGRNPTNPLNPGQMRQKVPG